MACQFIVSVINKTHLDNTVDNKISSLKYNTLGKNNQSYIIRNLEGNISNIAIFYVIIAWPHDNRKS